jgi:Zn-dependent peptidase ImmA (M78 family)
MARSIPALINPDILSWARSFMRLDINYVAEKADIEPETLNEWEGGYSRPTVSQIRKLAKVYRFPIAVFYLSQPPNLKIPRPRDRRLLPGFERRSVPPELNFEFRWANERREIVIELLANTGIKPKSLDAQVSLQDSPENVGGLIRKMLGISYEQQTSWRDKRVAFNAWRKQVEQLDVLVFQATDVSLKNMRGYSMFFEVLPIIGINRKDSYTARSFSLLHEITHLSLRMESLCDLEEENNNISTPDRNLEVFCNAVAGCTLVPGDTFIKEDVIPSAIEMGEEGDKAIEDLSRKYSVSREVIVRRMLTLRLVDEEFYKNKQEQYKREYSAMKPPSSGFVHPVDNAFSASGRAFVGLVVENLNRGFITTSDFSDFLRLKVKHLERIQDSFLRA